MAGLALKDCTDKLKDVKAPPNEPTLLLAAYFQGTRTGAFMEQPHASHINQAAEQKHHKKLFISNYRSIITLSIQHYYISPKYDLGLLLTL